MIICEAHYLQAIVYHTTGVTQIGTCDKPTSLVLLEGGGGWLAEDEIAVDNTAFHGMEVFAATVNMYMLCFCNPLGHNPNTTTTTSSKQDDVDIHTPCATQTQPMYSPHTNTKPPTPATQW